MPELAQSYEDVVASVRQFNQDLKESRILQNRLSNFRAWYVIPELNLVAPSKFIGYKDMNAQRYINEINELSGTETEPVLRKWFEVLKDESSEAVSVRSMVDSLAGQYNKRISTLARFNAPYNRIRKSPDPIVPKLQTPGIWTRYELTRGLELQVERSLEKRIASNMPTIIKLIKSLYLQEEEPDE